MTMVRSSASASGSHSLDILVHMAKRQMDHMNHIAKEITGQKKSHGKGNHMEKEITWQEKSQKYTEVKSQQMAFTQSPSVSICYLLFVICYLLFVKFMICYLKMCYWSPRWLLILKRH